MQKSLREFLKTDIAYPVIAKNSEVFAVGDPVSVVSGFLQVATASTKIYGYCNENYTAASDNQTVAGYAPQCLRSLGQTMRFDVTATALVQANVGSFALLTGTTGAIKINQATVSATVGQFLILGFGVDELGNNYADVEAAARQDVTTVS